MYYTVEKLDGFYRVSSAENVFCYLIVGSQKAMLIDTGYGFADLRAAVRSVTDKPLIVVNTHGHCDHAGGNARFDELCYLHRADWALCNAHTSERMRQGSVQRARHSIDFTTGQEYDALPADFDPQAYCAMGTGNLSELQEGDVFELGGAVVAAYETPGHTQGGISLLYREKDIVFTGDEANAFLWLFAPESTDRKTHIRSLEKLRALNADAYWGGHSPDPGRVGDIDLYIQAAQEAVYEKGVPFQAFIQSESEPRVCILGGFTMDDMFRPGFASIVISAGK